MQSFKKFRLENGLQVVVQPIKGASAVASNLMYRVGARDEQEQEAGIAHLFEHLAFGPSPYVASYDQALQAAGGVNNAYTGLDVTSYYTKLSSQNIATLFWLESNRMLGISHDLNYLAVQRKVVTEEFKQVDLNQPYGNDFSSILAAAYPREEGNYLWSPIGKSIETILGFERADLQKFEAAHYTPQNAVLAISGGTTVEEVYALAQKWFAPIPSRKTFQKKTYWNKTSTTYQSKYHEKEGSQFPANRIYKTYPTVERGHQNFFYYLLLTQLLVEGRNSFLVDQLVYKKKICTAIEAYNLETLGPGLMVFVLTLHDQQQPAVAEELFSQLLEKIVNTGFSKKELDQAKNQLITSYHLRQCQMEERAHDLALATFLGDTNFFDAEQKRIATADGLVLQELAKELSKRPSATLIYRRKN